MPAPRGPEQQEHKPAGESIRSWTNGTVGLAECLAKVPAAFLRVPPTVGPKFFGNWQSGIALFGGFLFVSHYNPVHGLLFFWIVAGAFFGQRLGGLWRENGVHSFAGGASIIPGDHFRALGVWEPTLTFLVGLAFCLVSPGVGTFLIICSLGLAISFTYMKMKLQAQSQAMSDARAEQMFLQSYHTGANKP